MKNPTMSLLQANIPKVNLQAPPPIKPLSNNNSNVDKSKWLNKMMSSFKQDIEFRTMQEGLSMRNAYDPGTQPNQYTMPPDNVINKTYGNDSIIDSMMNATTPRPAKYRVQYADHV